MSEDSQRFDLYSRLEPVLSNLQSINNQFDTQRQQISNLTYNVDKLHLATKNKEMDGKNLEWLYSLQNREAKLTTEIQSHENKKAQIEQLQEKTMLYKQQMELLQIDNQKLRKQVDTLSAKNEQLISEQGTALKLAIREVNESFISRITQLEAQQYTRSKEDSEMQLRIVQLTNQVKVLESSKAILHQECEEFEIVRETLIKEKSMYLNEFRNLKDSYMRTIDQLQSELHRLKVQYHSVSEDNKHLEQTVEYYRNRFQEVMDLHELASLNSDTQMLQLLKQKGMEKVTEQDMKQARQEVVEDMTIRKGFQLNSAWDQVMSDIGNIN